MTMALRTPTLRNSCGPAASGTRTAVTSSPGASAVRLGPTTSSDTGTVRVPAADATSTRASRANSAGSVSPAGDAVARLPPIVPVLRTCGLPTVRAAAASAGTLPARSGSSSSV
jgi:hypothetical protein